MTTSLDTPITGATGEIFWRYEVPTNKGGTMQLLTIGRVATKGPWTGALGENYIAWAPMPRRDKDTEGRLIEAGIIPR